VLDSEAEVRRAAGSSAGDTAALELSGKSAVAVLLLGSMASDPEQESLFDGITEDNISIHST